MGTEEGAKRVARFPARWVIRAYRWHMLAFLALNAALGLINAFTGRPWWAFWLLVITGFVLAIHYFLYKTLAADERWVEERTEELNLKSYDRGHIEDLKTRYGVGKGLGDGRQ